MSGQDLYLGPHGTKVSNNECDRVIAEWLGSRPVSAPLKFQALQQAAIGLGWTRGGINSPTQRIVRSYRGAATQELVKADVAIALQTAGGLHQGRTTARESTPVLPVADAIVQQTLPHMSPTVATWLACNG